ncbi:DEAD/DEAH box helicase [Mycobacterium sp. 1423905.2]|uniref:DEAD/DEAH box helicase n=1 Tax=Mycobacterium sp. 1423905.2 TaxID=1856859 RepID=UPI00352B91A7
MSSTPIDALARFSAVTRDWFASTFPAPTTAQASAWSAIAAGDNTLVIAPTGSGKTLAAFLWALDSLAAAPERPSGTSVLYVSPLKARAAPRTRHRGVPRTTPDAHPAWRPRWRGSRRR